MDPADEGQPRAALFHNVKINSSPPGLVQLC